jgi:hypothetical protein
MNQVGEIIVIDSIKCRQFNVQELMYVLKSEINKFWSWGAHAFTADNVQNASFFRMTVSGHHHKGHVYIALNGMDLYDVYLTSNRGTIKQRTPEMGLYFDQLVEWIDDKVERIPEYKD